jgi:putative membrane protein
VAASAAEVSEEGHRQIRRGHVLFQAPRPPLVGGLILLLGFLLAFLMFYPDWRLVAEAFAFVFAGPALLAVVLTTPLAALLGGRFELHRAMFLSLIVLVLVLPIVVVWQGLHVIWPTLVPGEVVLGAFLAGPMFWFRQMSLYGVSRASHARMLLPALVQPVGGLVGLFLLLPPPWTVQIAALVFLVLGFLCSAMLIRASDRPIRREFQSSGVALIRPLLDHVGGRDPAATRSLESFFARSAVPADLKVGLFAFVRDGRTRATLALPTVHPGPFAALGSSDLPRKLTEQLGPTAGIVLVPHTPCDHDLNLPSGAELDRVGAACRELLAGGASPVPQRASPLVAPYPGSFARAQLLGDVVLIVVSQAPQPTDDIAYSVGDRIVREIAHEGGPRIEVLDAHNSYIEGQGDVLYGTPTAEKIVNDAKAAVRAARAAAVDGPIEIGVAARLGYDTKVHGIGPQGMEALVVRAAGKTSAYLIIDANNLVIGMRQSVVAELERFVDAAEVLTTDNHVVHEVDGTINALGERYPVTSIARDGSEVLRAALADLRPTEVRYGSKGIPAVKVLGPGYTARLLTSLGDTLSMFTHMFVASFLLLLTSSLVVVFAIT